MYMIGSDVEVDEDFFLHGPKVSFANTRLQGKWRWSHFKCSKVDGVGVTSNALR